MPNVYSQHGASVMSNGINGHLGPATMQSNHLHTTPHISHNISQQQERPFKCDQCPQSFNRNHDLKRHKRIHLAVKPFPCPNCEKSFSRKDALKVRLTNDPYLPKLRANLTSSDMYLLRDAVTHRNHQTTIVTAL